MNLIMDICQTDTQEAHKAKIRELKYILQPHLSAYQKFLKRVYAYKKHWLLHYMSDVFTGGNHTYNRSAAIYKQL